MSECGEMSANVETVVGCVMGGADFTIACDVWELSQDEIGAAFDLLLIQGWRGKRVTFLESMGM
jgi:hypothetical protein